MFSPGEDVAIETEAQRDGPEQDGQHLQEPDQEEHHDHQNPHHPGGIPLGAEQIQGDALDTMDWTAHTIQQTKKIMDIAKVMFRSALPPRSSGL